ncbi:hypothetical protein RHSIM_Rhsim08G0106800 [Rhododendron simsii]|uniref:Uncharacterized protein n=1 Tax=Rhododendron simsii TaxID=118357 RepID=A0A834GI68_RHOSS|nr:hypothetical protein RHSIM_Rhsim08G0106800 [Rhododendron simsii]
MLLPVSPGLNFWYYLAIISSLSWVFSSLAMDFIKKTTLPISVFLISTLVLSWFTSNFALSKLYLSLQRNPETDRFFHGYEGAGKTIAYVPLLFGNVVLYYFSEKSVACMLTFLFLSFYCLCCLLCIQPYTDFGALDFLLSATLNQTLNLFGLRSSYTWLVMVACIGIAGLRYCLEPVHAPGEATSDEADQLESGQLLPTACKEEPPPLGAQLANKDPSQFGCILELALSGSTNPLLEGDFIGRLKIPPKRGPVNKKRIPESFTGRLARLRSTN